MENASKALLIAGSMLLVILVATFAVYMFNRLGTETSNFYQEIKQSDINEFNQQFLQYDVREGEGTLTAHDVISIINLAKNNNQTGKMQVEVEVILDGVSAISQIKNEQDKNSFLESNIEKKYSCLGVEYSSNSVINKISLKTLN